MSRPLSATAQLAAYSQETSEVFLILLEIDHADLAVPIRVVNNSVDIVSNLETYTAYPFQINPPAEREGKVTNAQLTIDNVTQELTIAFRSLTSPPPITMSVILADSPDVVELGPLEFIVREITYNSQTIQAELVYEDRLDIEVPGLSYTPQYFPGLF